MAIATTRLKRPAEPTPVPHLPRPTNQEASLVSTADNITATHRLLRDNTAVEHHLNMAVTAKVNTEERSNSTKDTVRRLASVDRDQATAAHLLADTDSKQDMVVRRRVTTVDLRTMTITSTTRYVCEDGNHRCLWLLTYH
jgi:hypothetical protein